MLLEALIFLRGSGGCTSRYSFDRYVTINILVSQSFSVIPKRLLEDGLIEIFREDDDVKIKITERGNQKIEGIYMRLRTFFEKLKSELINNLPLESEIYLHPPILWFQHKHTFFTFKVIAFEQPIKIKLSISPISNFTLKSKLTFSEEMSFYPNFLVNIIKTHLDLINMKI